MKTDITRPLKNNTEYEEALAEYEPLFNKACVGYNKMTREEVDRFERLGPLILEYEERKHPIKPPTNWGMLSYYIEEMGFFKGVWTFIQYVAWR